MFLIGFLSFCLPFKAVNDLEKSIYILLSSCSEVLLELSLHIFVELTISPLSLESILIFALFSIFYLFELFLPILSFLKSMIKSL